MVVEKVPRRSTACGITIGIIPPLSECIVVAHEGRHTLAMLKRQQGESVAQLLSRLDLAIAKGSHRRHFH